MVFIVLLIYSVLAADSIFWDSADIFTPKRRTFIASLRVLITVSACTFASSILPVFMASSIFFLSAFSYPFNFSAYLSICLALRRNSIATSIRSGFDISTYRIALSCIMINYNYCRYALWQPELEAVAGEIRDFDRVPCWSSQTRRQRLHAPLPKG